MRVLISAAASVLLMLAFVVPVASAGPGCSDFGAATVAGAHAGKFGQVVSSVKNGAFAPDFYSVVELVQFEHGLYCAK